MPVDLATLAVAPGRIAVVSCVTLAAPPPPTPTSPCVDLAAPSTPLPNPPCCRPPASTADASLHIYVDLDAPSISPPSRGRRKLRARLLRFSPTHLLMVHPHRPAEGVCSTQGSLIALE
ncbi:unnamed protein product [Urochloa humidicola]